MSKRITTARQAVQFFFKDDARLASLADTMAARLRGPWERSQGQSPAMRLGALMAAADEQISAQREANGVRLPCKAGCHHCCVQQVTVSTTEAVLIVRHIENALDATTRAEVIASIAAAGPSGATAQSPCALLGAAGTCRVYDSRPMACRSYNGLSEPACRTFRHDRRLTAPVMKEAVVVDAALREVSRLFRHSGAYEINTLLRRIYSDPDKPARWAAEAPSDETDLAKAS